ncbi:MAG: NERD domain-containing protein [Candidatus Nitrosotenuis sp.]|nr:MAG: NERD domain-containing protein [Candidatus Nitrosotenuis sp.]
MNSLEIKNFFVPQQTDLSIIYGRADSEKQLLSKYPKEIKKIEDIPIVYEKLKESLKEKDAGFFGFIKRWNKKRKILKFHKNKNKQLHAGSDGENKVIECFSALGDDYHVLCGVRIELPYWIAYNGQKNLRSAQMDFVVVSKKGVFLIEVKNWSDSFVKNHNGFSPHEQTDRAGRVLWVILKPIMKDIQVTNVLLSIQGNIRYNRNYRMVLVSSLEKINRFLESRQDILSEREVNRIVINLKRYVTK